MLRRISHAARAKSRVPLTGQRLEQRLLLMPKQNQTVRPKPRLVSVTATIVAQLRTELTAPHLVRRQIAPRIAQATRLSKESKLSIQ